MPLALFVSIMWAVAYVGGVWQHDFSPFLAITPIEVVVVGAVFHGIIKNGRNGHA